MWRVEAGGAIVAVKRAPLREREALARMQPLCPDVPEVLAELEGAIVLSWIDGRTADEVRGDAGVVHERAGALLRRIHSVPVEDRDAVSIADALALRIDRWCARARGLVAEQIVARVRSCVDPSAFDGVARVQCHRDYTPGNWIVRPDGSVAAIDFGQARLDLPQWDFVKLAADAWVDRPDLRARFVAGYGDDDARVDRLVALHGLQTLVWGLEHDDAHFIALGRRVLERVTA